MAYYCISVRGHLSPEWSEWFDGMVIAPDPPGTWPGGSTTLSGPVVDQAALYGLLIRARDLGLELISVRRIGPEIPLLPGQTDEPSVADSRKT